MHRTTELISPDDWIARESLTFPLDASAEFAAAVDRMVAVLGDAVEVLGIGEPLHGGEGFLQLRNRLFQHLVQAHGYRAIAVESSFPRGRITDAYVSGGGPGTYDGVQEAGFSHGFGHSPANRELIEWIRQFNAESGRHAPLRFYGFDSPTEMMTSDSPRTLLHFVLDYLAAIDGGRHPRRAAIDDWLGNDADWETAEAALDPAKSVGRSPAATALRIETEELLIELANRRPELVARSDADRYREAVRYATLARQMLGYHAGVATPSEDRIARLLGLRDAMMADNLAYIAERERGRGKVLAFAHNSHLKLAPAEWQLGPQRLVWWPAGAQLREMLGPRYGVIGVGVHAAESQGIAPAEPGTLEARLATAPGTARFVPTHRGQGLSAETFAELPTRSASTTNPTYFSFTPQSVREYDALLVLG